MNQDKEISEKSKEPCSCGPVASISASMPAADNDEPCCGPPPGPEASPFEKPGYMLCGFVEGFARTPAGLVPAIKTRLSAGDIWGAIKARLNIGRNNYKIAPGLYLVGKPGKYSPVLVTANYKLSFDKLRRELKTIVDAWILVLDTRGINVWCAAGKGTFSTDEIVRRIKLTDLDKVALKKELILPQLSAPGVSAHKVREKCGFKVIWGPIRARDLKKFLQTNQKADYKMRQVTFSMLERLVLIPVEVSCVLKPMLWVFLTAFILSGIGPAIFSFFDACSRSLMVLAAFVMGIISGAVLVPALLPWIPQKAFSLKGAIMGLPAGVATISLFNHMLPFPELAALFLCTVSASSYISMNFTGTTPFTSPSGVEKEMRAAIPLQACALLIACAIWVASSF